MLSRKIETDGLAKLSSPNAGWCSKSFLWSLTCSLYKPRLMPLAHIMINRLSSLAEFHIAVSVIFIFFLQKISLLFDQQSQQK